MPEREASRPGPPLEEFVEGRTDQLSDWRWLIEGDHRFPVRSHRPVLGRLVVFLKKLFAPLVRAPQSDLWDRQRALDLVLLQQLENQIASLTELRASFDELGQELQSVQRELVADLGRFQADYRRDQSDLVERLEALEEFRRRAIPEINAHHDALFARLDQKLDRLRRERASRPGD